jgi:arylsulfatase A-like enzyme
MITPKPNVLLVTIDCLRYDHLGCYGYTRDTSPNIDKIASKGALFRQAISNGGNTPSAFPSILASILPPLDTDEHKTIIKRHTTLAEVFRDAGYRTAAFNSSPWLNRLWSYSNGFDTFDEGWGDTPKFWILRMWLAERVVKAISNKLILSFLAKLDKYVDSFSFAFRGKAPCTTAEQTSSQALSWLNSHNNHFFLWLHYIEAHAPYMPPQKFIKQFRKKPLGDYKMSALWRRSATEPDSLTSSEIGALIDSYDACIRYIDDSIGWLLANAGNRLKNTIIVVTADHGDEFGEHTKMGHLTLYDHIIHVPLIVAGPGIEPGLSVKGQVESIDLAPTLAELAGLDKPATFKGRLLPLVKSENQVARGVVSVALPPGVEPKVIFSYRTPQWKYIRTESLADPQTVLVEEVYNLQNDPEETVNLNSLEAEEIQEFKHEALKAIVQVKQRKLAEMTVFEAERVREKIKKLAKL